MSTIAVLEKEPATRGKASAGIEMSEWPEGQEDLMAMIGTFEHNLGTVAFRNRESIPTASVGCSCGRGGVNNFCNWAY